MFDDQLLAYIVIVPFTHALKAVANILLYQFIFLQDQDWESAVLLPLRFTI